MSMRKFIFSDPEKCTGCKICELVCSAVNEDEFNPLLSRIRTVRLEAILNTSLTCRLCDDPTCVRVCPRKALSQDEETGLIIVDEDQCTGCGWCIEACEFGVIMLPRDRKYIIICDLCEGEPKCIEFCPKEALSLVTTEEVGQRIRKKAVAKLLKEGG